MTTRKHQSKKKFARAVGVIIFRPKDFFLVRTGAGRKSTAYLSLSGLEKFARVGVKVAE